ncbi:MAG: hypothetical protein ABI589_11400 [Burkholderiales bacterium]
MSNFTGPLRAQARRLHRAALSESVSASLPVLRRLRAAGIFSNEPLSVLFAGRRQIKRKHLLRLLAIEAGFGDWESLCAAVAHDPCSRRSEIDLIERCWMHANDWFATEREAHAYAAVHGGKVRRYAGHAVILRPDPQVLADTKTRPSE